MFMTLVGGGVLAFLLGTRLSSEALGNAVFLLFGLCAGIPALLLTMASDRRRRPADYDDDAAGAYNPRQLTAQPAGQVHIVHNHLHIYQSDPLAASAGDLAQRYQASLPAAQRRLLTVGEDGDYE